MTTRVLHIGVASREFVKRRTMEIVTGRRPRTEGEPTLYVTSLEALAKILSEKNMLLLDMIRQTQPQSLAELAKISGRAKGNLSRTLHSMERLGLVAFTELAGRKVPSALYDKVKVEFELGSAPKARKAA